MDLWKTHVAASLLNWEGCIQIFLPVVQGCYGVENISFQASCCSTTCEKRTQTTLSGENVVADYFEKYHRGVLVKKGLTWHLEGGTSSRFQTSIHPPAGCHGPTPCHCLRPRARACVFNFQKKKPIASHGVGHSGLK